MQRMNLTFFMTDEERTKHQVDAINETRGETEDGNCNHVIIIIIKF